MKKKEKNDRTMTLLFVKGAAAMIVYALVVLWAMGRWGGAA